MPLAAFTELGLQSINPGGCVSPDYWTTTQDAGIMSSINPATEEPLASIFQCSSGDLNMIIQKAHEAFHKWRMVPAPKRGEVVRAIGQALRDKKDALGTLISMEVGKIKTEGDGEVQEMIDMADLAVGQSRMLYGHTMHSERPFHRMYEQWHPLGVVNVISAFNFPVAVWAWNAFIAAIAGNTVIWKPSPKAPLCALAVQHICNQVTREFGQEGIFSLCMTDQSAVAEAMVQDSRIPLVSFTGSVPVGRHVAELVAHRLGRSLLELSGNNAVIVDETADFDLAIPAIVFGAVGTAGQRCTTTRRLLVHHTRMTEIIDRLRHAYGQIRIGNPLDPRTLMGPLIDHDAVDTFQAAIEEIRQHDGEIIFGGQVLNQPGFFVEPTLVRGDPRWEIVQRETFGPILYIMPYNTFDEALAMHNDVPQGLSSSLFTMNIRHAEQFLSVLGSDCGIANINIGTSGAEIGGAFGGEKETGGGREAGSDAWKSYMRRQTTTINWGTDLPLAQGITFSL